MEKTFIWIRTEKEFLHCYPGAPEQVSFLKNKHSHIFKFKVYIEVFNNDRDIEFIIFKRFIDDFLNNTLFNIDDTNDLEDTSCEMLSDILYSVIKAKYPNRQVKISVSEDNNYGCFKEYT